MSITRVLLVAVLLCSPDVLAASLADVAAQFGLTQTTSLAFPAQALDANRTAAWMKSHWQLNGNRIQFGQSALAFTTDPSTNSSLSKRQSVSSSSSSSSHRRSSSTSSPLGSSSSSSSRRPSSTSSATLPTETGAAVLSVDYPQGSFSHSTGGAQFFSQPFNSSNTAPEAYTSMLLSYEIFFPSPFAFNKGGKLPGLRGGPNPRDCSGGSQTDGTGCFSTRLMWRAGGEGEVYAYIPTSVSGFCSESQVICNSDYGTSLARGSFSFQAGQWQTIWLVVQLNQVGTANGQLQLYYNGVQAMSFSNLEFRSAASLNSIGGLYFSTFFGGDDDSWATPVDQKTYYRNFQLMAGTNVATGSGKATSGADRLKSSGGILAGLCLGSLALFLTL